MNRIFISGIFLFLLSSAFKINAQGENNIWCFGAKVGMNFNVSPAVFFETKMQVFEGSASVSDAAGNLLFYSSGAYNWDRNGNLMPNGAGLSGNGPTGSIFGTNWGSSYRGVAIVKSPANTNQYFIIITDAIEDNLFNAYYSVLDMSLNGGLGDVIPSQKNILLTSDITEGIMITPAAGCSGYWAILHKKIGADYLAFKIGMTGINPAPVISTGLNTTSYFGYGSIGASAFDKTGLKLLRGRTLADLAVFNTTTGTLSGFALLNIAPQTANSFIFSPDGSKLYYSSADGIFQFNLSLLPNITAVQNSRILIDTMPTCDMRMGPDHKIYVLSYSPTSYIGVIAQPDALGTACSYTPTTYLLPGYISLFNIFYELGNPVVISEPKDTLINRVTDTIVCQLNQVTLNADALYQDPIWSTGKVSATETINQDGTYWVRGLKDCQLYVDSFHVRFVRFDVGLGRDTIICKGENLLLDAGNPGATYLWQDGSTGRVYAVNNKGRYFVLVTKENCNAVDTIDIGMIEPYMHILGQDTLICKGEQITIKATAFPQSSYIWNDGNTDPERLSNGAGAYTVTASNICGTFMDSIKIKEQLCYCDAFVPNAFSPNGDGNNDVFDVKLNCPGMNIYLLMVYNRYGQQVFKTQQSGVSWNGTFDGRQMDSGTYFYYLEYETGSGNKIQKKGDIILIR